jgi:dihydrofolate synthase/folylpolyglutamate synthase
MNYAETLDYMFAQLPMFSRTGPAAYKADLNNTIALCEAFDHPENGFKSIHIAGTNGKGSTSHQLAAILQSNGYKTGLYTSPHLKDFRERIRINGVMIPQDVVIDFIERYRKMKLDISPSFFELTVVMAFDYFRKEQVDIAMIETGLGGRLDSTNVIDPILSIITNIGTDHANLLGETRELIASEKAGIIKSGVPVIIGEKDDETKSVFINKANISNTEIYWSCDHYRCTEIKTEEHDMQIEVDDVSNQSKQQICIDLKGHYQLLNLPAVLVATDLLPALGFSLNVEKTRQSLSEVKSRTGLRGRWDLVDRNPDIVLDVAHNKEGIRAILEQIKLQYPASKLHWIIGMVQDKDVDSVLALLPKDALYYVTQAQIPRAIPYSTLTETMHTNGFDAHGYADVNLALKAAKQSAQPNDLILICGSFFILAELEAYL